ncbi:hypothetical protein LCGC14_0342990 [marine sediment metagenome]|uniref:DUF1937 domain-containing protein n=1 Tax=marine sediment metagenome TaxID=412755 RepID=A0A0F9W0D1_9ZZZZ
MQDPKSKRPDKPVVYIASPYTRGDQALNVRASCKVWDELLTDGVVWPVTPLWTHFQHMMFPRGYRDWMNADEAMFSLYDALLRIPAICTELNYEQTESRGADEEEKWFRAADKPVFYNKEDLYTWVHQHFTTVLKGYNK